jgi:hypothetical protein
MYALILFYCVDICRCLSSKEIHKEDTMYWKKEIPRLMCQMKQHIPPTLFNAQEHYLIHQVEEIELCGPVHTRSMWMVERQLKSLKGFVRQKTGPKGSMVEGHMVYQCMVYISQYLPKLAKNMNVPHIWHLDSINKFEGEVLLGKGKMRTMKCNY